MKTVLCFGEVLWDAFGDEKKAGGAPMNVARHLVQQKVNVQFASRVGTDDSGNQLTEFLMSNGLFSDLIQFDEELPTCEVTVELDSDGQASYIIPQPVSWDNIELDETLAEVAKKASVVVFGSLACRSQATRDTLEGLLEENHCLKVFDVNLRPPHYEQGVVEALAARANVIKMNEEEAQLLIGGVADDENMKRFQHAYQLQTICITRGGSGAIVWHDGSLYQHPGFKVEVADTVGAGDSFLATFIAGLLNDQPMDLILEQACKVGAFVASQRGANPEYPAGLIS